MDVIKNKYFLFDVFEGISTSRQFHLYYDTTIPSILRQFNLQYEKYDFRLHNPNEMYGHMP
jgi:hypothetical protein